jgi:hypothetical protein
MPFMNDVSNLGLWAGTLMPLVLMLLCAAWALRLCWHAFRIRHADLFLCGLFMATASGLAGWLIASGRLHPFPQGQATAGDLCCFLLVLTVLVACGRLIPLVMHLTEARTPSVSSE